MKLSKAQERTINQAKAKIDKARAYKTFDDYFDAEIHFCVCETAKVCKKVNREAYERLKKNWEDMIQGIVLVDARKVTLLKLQELSLIEVINSGHIRVLNY